MFGFLALGFIFIGCPEPVGSGGSKGTENKDIGGGAGQNVENSDGSVNTDHQHARGTCNGDGPENQSKPKYTQSDLSGGGVITGYVKCDSCSSGGQILINAMNPPPKEESQGSPDDQSLIAQKIISKPGNFSIRVPNKTRVQLQVVDDTNNDGVCSQGEAFGIRGSGPIYVDGSAENIELTVGSFPQKDMTGSMNNPDQNVPSTPTTVPAEPPSQNVDVPDTTTQTTESASPGDGPPPDDK